MGEPMDPTTQPLPPTPNPTPSFLLSKNAFDASRTEILVLASGILFLASQVCLLAWILRRTSATPREKHQRKVAIILPGEAKPSPPDTLDAQHDVAIPIIASGSSGKDDSALRLRRSSSWGGSSAHPGSHDPQGRRKSAGWLSEVRDSDDDGDEEQGKREGGAQNSLSSPGPGSKPEAGRGAEDTELKELDAQRAWGEGDLLVVAATSSIEKPPSPRSPRVLAADQAAMIDALCAEKDTPSPVGGAEVDAPALAFGFEDPLGVNRLVDLPEENEQGHEAVELELRDGERRDA